MLVDLAGHLGCHHEHPVRGQHKHPVICLVPALKYNNDEIPWQNVQDVSGCVSSVSESCQSIVLMVFYT